MEYVKYGTEIMPIDDIATLLKFYYDCQKRRTEPVQVKDSMQTTGRFNYYLDGKQYTFYSEDALKVLDLMIGREEPQGKLERIKEKIAHAREHKKETLDFVVKELNRRLNEFFYDRLNF